MNHDWITGYGQPSLQEQQNGSINSQVNGVNGMANGQYGDLSQLHHQQGLNRLEQQALAMQSRAFEQQLQLQSVMQQLSGGGGGGGGGGGTHNLADLQALWQMQLLAANTPGLGLSLPTESLPTSLPTSLPPPSSADSLQGLLQQQSPSKGGIDAMIRQLASPSTPLSSDQQLLQLQQNQFNLPLASLLSSSLSSLSSSLHSSLPSSAAMSAAALMLANSPSPASSLPLSMPLPAENKSSSKGSKKKQQQSAPSSSSSSLSTASSVPSSPMSSPLVTDSSIINKNEEGKGDVADVQGGDAVYEVGEGREEKAKKQAKVKSDDEDYEDDDDDDDDGGEEDDMDDSRRGKKQSKQNQKASKKGGAGSKKKKKYEDEDDDDEEKAVGVRRSARNEQREKEAMMREQKKTSRTRGERRERRERKKYGDDGEEEDDGFDPTPYLRRSKRNKDDGKDDEEGGDEGDEDDVREMKKNSDSERGEGGGGGGGEEDEVLAGEAAASAEEEAKEREKEKEGIKELKQMWQFASVVMFFEEFDFGDVFPPDFMFDPTLLASGLACAIESASRRHKHSGYNMLRHIHLCLLRIGHKQHHLITLKNWEEKFKDRIQRHLDTLGIDRVNPMIYPDRTLAEYYTLPLLTKVLLLKNFLERQLSENPFFRDQVIIPNEKKKANADGIEGTVKRKEIAGEDDQGAFYWLCERQNPLSTRMYKEVVPPSSGGAIAQIPAPAEPGLFELVAGNLLELQVLTTELAGQKSSRAKELQDLITETVIPELMSQEKLEERRKRRGIDSANILELPRPRRPRREVNYRYDTGSEGEEEKE